MQLFRSSINIQFDLPDARLLDRYILTPSHGEVLNGILEGVTGQGARHAHLLIGPYGTGKSLLATILCQLLSRRFADEWRDRLHAQAERIDTMLAARLRQVERLELTYLPVMINGKTGSLRTIVNQAIYRALHQAGIRVTTPNEAASILDTVDRWRCGYAETYARFSLYLARRGVTEAEWREQIESCLEEPTHDFIAFYPTVTSGTPWMIGHEAYFVDNLEVLADELAARGIGLWIVYDEFGRFLQSLGGEDTLRDMQDLQNFAEFVDRTDNVHVLFVGHKHIRQYGNVGRESIRSEFEKVEKRMRFYSLENDADTFLHLAQEAIAETNASCLNDGTFLETLQEAQRFALFAEFTAYQLEHGIIRMLYPLHPAAVMLLPQLSNIFGQNERTLFSFLSDNERYSLRDHVHQHGGYYYADRLFDFFGVGIAEQRDLPGLQLYHAIAPFLESREPLQQRIAQLLAMWSVTRLTQKQPATTDFLVFALGTGPAETAAALEQLSAGKIVRSNSIRGQWELYDGSSIDLEAVIAERALRNGLQGRDMIDLLERHLPFAYVLPYEYNDEMDMLRYADIRFTYANELKTFRLEDLPADDRIWLVVYRNADEVEDPSAMMGEIGEACLAAFPSFTVEPILPTLLRFKLLDQLLHDPVFLSQDPRLKNELTFMIEETSKAVRSFVDRYFDFRGQEWWSGAQRKPIRDLHGLECLVTERLRARYAQSPLIRNEAFNRSRISAIQRRALSDVIDRLIERPEEPALGIEGYGPNYLIYATALKNNGYFFGEAGSVQCGGTLAAVQEALREALDRRPIGRLSDLMDLMKAPPYGIRPPVIPLLFVALLRDRWDQLLFYSHDMLIAHLSGNAVLELAERADMYEYRYYNWSPEERQQLVELGRPFALPPEACASFLHVAEALLQWLRGLPKFTQITRQTTPASERIRDMIRSAEVDPYVHMKQLATNVEELVAAKEELERFLDVNARLLEQRVLELTGQASFTQLAAGLKRLRNEAIGMNSRLLTLAEGEDGAGTVDRLAAHLVGVERTEWSDATQELFLGQIKYEWELLHAGSEVAVANEPSVDLNRPMSKKSQTLYANVKNMLKYAGKDVSTQDIRQLLVKLLQEL